MYKLYIPAFIISLTASLLFTYVVKQLAQKFGVLDIPDPRRVHSTPIPRWGGLAIFAGVISGILVLLFFSTRFHQLIAFKHKVFVDNEVVGMLSIGKQLTGIIVASIIIVILGMIDDKKGVAPIPKLLTQIIAAYVTMDYGVRISGLVLPWNQYFFVFPTLLSQIITVLWLISFMNTINLVDGLDGLAAGITAIAAFTFFVVAILQGQTQIILFAKQLKLAAILAIILCGACIGFLYHNFFPAKIFMGDTGSMLLGFLLGTIAVIGTLKSAALIALIIPVIVVALPVLDVLMAILRRFSRGRPIMEPDKEHFHHRLLQWGWSQREAVLLIYLLTIILSEGAIILTVFRALPQK